MNIEQKIFWQFEKYVDANSKKRCPQCLRKTFVRIVNQNGEPFGDDIGKCDREVKCGYFKKPNGIVKLKNKIKMEAEKKMKVFDKSNIEQTVIFKDNLSLWLIHELGQGIKDVLKKYNVGTSKQFGGGSTVFYQIDSRGEMRTAKIMKYDVNTGKRIKEPPMITWLHAINGYKPNDDEQIVQCLFGSHLLMDNQTKPVAIVESEKTAIIMSYFVPEFIWLATGGLQNLNVRTLTQLKENRNFATLFPDDGAEDKWLEKTKECFFMTLILNDWKRLYKRVIDLMDDSGYDIADAMMKEFKLFKNQYKDNKPIE